MIKPVHVYDLKDQTNVDYPRPILYCEICGNKLSANKGDYFRHDPDYLFVCCGLDMRLVIEETIFKDVKF